MKRFLGGVALGAALVLLYVQWEWQREAEWFARRWR